MGFTFILHETYNDIFKDFCLFAVKFWTYFDIFSLHFCMFFVVHLWWHLLVLCGMFNITLYVFCLAVVFSSTGFCFVLLWLHHCGICYYLLCSNKTNLYNCVLFKELLCSNKTNLYNSLVLLLFCFVDFWFRQDQFVQFSSFLLLFCFVDFWPLEFELPVYFQSNLIMTHYFQCFWGNVDSETSTNKSCTQVLQCFRAIAYMLVSN